MAVDRTADGIGDDQDPNPVDTQPEPTRRTHPNQRPSDSTVRHEPNTDDRNRSGTPPRDDQSEGTKDAAREPDGAPDPLTERKSYGGFANLAEEFDARSKSRQRAREPSSESHEILKDSDEDSPQESSQPTDPSDDEPIGFAKQSNTSLSKNFETGANGDPDPENPQKIAFRVGDKSLREHLDPVGAAAWSYETLENPDTTDRVPDTENQKEGEKSRLERFRKAFRREGEDYIDQAEKAADRIQNIMKGPPPGHLVERAGHEISSAPHYGPDAGNIVTAALAAGAMMGEGVHLLHKHIKKRKEDT